MSNVVQLNPARPRLTPVRVVLTVIAPGSIEIEGDRVKLAIIRDFTIHQIRELADQLKRLADFLQPSDGGPHVA